MPPLQPDLSSVEGWMDYYISKIPDPLVHKRTGQILTRFQWGEFMCEREYWRRLFKGEYPEGNKTLGMKRFIEEMSDRSGPLFKYGIWPKLPRFTKKYVSIRCEFAPLCEGGCGKKVIGFAPWGEVDPFLRICHRCKQKSKTQILTPSP